MSKEKKLALSKDGGLIPDLRFPEFKDNGEWTEIKLKQLGSFFRGLTYGAEDTDSKGLLVLRSGNIQNDSIVFDKDLVFVKKDCPEDLKLLIGDVVICMSNGSKALVGKNAEFKGDYNGQLTVGAFCSIMRPKNSFTKYLLQTDSYQLFIALSIGGGNINNLKNSDLEEYVCSAPKGLEEQKKIASCLSSLDELISAHSDKLHLLKDTKKGLMQRLFPQAGEKVPKLRFREFEKNGKWEEKALGKLAIRITKKNSNGNITKVFTNSSVKGIVDQRDYFDKDIANKGNLENYLLVEPGDYVYNPRVSSAAPVGPVAKNRTGEVGVMSPLYTVFRFKEHNNDFYEYYFKSSHWYNSIKKVSNTGARFDRMSITPSELMEVIVLFPKPQEQQKIADTLSSLDDLINAQVEKIEQLKAHKKGLMQKMFPAHNELI